MALTRITKGVIKPNENYDTHNINSTGIITAVGANFSGNVSVGGTLTYEDVTSIDSVGIITARGDIHVGENIAHIGDTDTKIVFTNNNIDLQSGGTSRISVGNFGLFVQTGLQLGFLASTGPSPSIKSGGTNNQDLLITSGTGNPTRLAVKVDGNVGVGLESPSAKFHVNGTTNGLQARFGGAGTGLGILCFQKTNNNAGVTFEAQDATHGTLTFKTAGSERLRITSGGQVLIGTTDAGHSSADDLTINNSGSGGITIRTGTTSNGAIFFADSTSGDARFDGFVQYNHGSSPYMMFGTAGDERVRITNGGNLKLPDNAKIELGGGQAGSGDLEIFFDGTHSKIDHKPTSGSLFLASDSLVLSNSGMSQYYLQAAENGAVSLNYSGSTKLATSNTGISITGIPVATQSTGNIGLELHATGSGRGSQIKIHNDHGTVYFGQSGDTTGDLLVYNESNTNIKFYTNGNNERLRITSAGTLQFIGQNTSLETAGITHHTNNNLYVRGGTSGLVLSNHDSTNTIHISNSDFIKFETTDGTEKFKINSIGQLTSTASNNGQIIHYFKNINTTSSSSAMTVEQHFNFDRTGGGLNLSAARIIAGKEREWVGAASNQDGYFAIHTTQNETSAEKLRITSAGNIGIGTITPRAKFDVRPGGHSGNGAILFTHNLGEVGSSNNAIQSINGVGSALQPLGYRATEHIFATQSAERLRIPSGGGILIGSGNQTKTQDGVMIERNSVDGAVHITAGRSGGNYSGMNFYVAGASGVTLRHQVDYQSNFKWFAADGTTERLRIHSHGQLELKVPDANDALKITPSGTNAHAKINFSTPGTGAAVIKVQGAERLSIGADGRITNTGIATSFVTTSFAGNYAKLDLRGTNIANTNHYILSYGEGHANDHQFHMVNTLGSLVFRTGTGSNTERLIIDSSGRLMVGTTIVGRPGADELTVGDGSGDRGITIRSGTSNEGNIYFSDSNSAGNGELRGVIRFDHSNDSLQFSTARGNNFATEKLRIKTGGNLIQTLTSTSGTSPFQDSHWYDRDGGNYNLSTTDHDSFTAVRTSSGGTYDNLIYKRVKMSKNCDIEFDLSGNTPSGTYRHVGFTLNADGTNANYDRLVFRYRPGSTSSNQIRIDKANGGGYGFQKNGSYIPNFFDGTERHIIIQLRERLVNVLVDGVVIISEKNNADFYNSSGWFGFGIYEGGENAQVTIRNLEIRNKFQRPRWLVRATGVNVDVSQNNPFPYNQVILASSDMNNSSHYNTGSYRFTAPISGLYYVFLRVYRNSSSGSEVAFFVNGSVRNRFRPQPNGGDFIFAGSCLIQLMKDEYIDVRPFNGSFDNFYGNSSQEFSTWGGHLLD
tara:strand:+ start:349 stop:4380 length:4032 start_codon:yes stop_codon:yes gene_type:complete